MPVRKRQEIQEVLRGLSLTKVQIREAIRGKIKNVDRGRESFAICCRIEEILPEEGLILAFEPLEDEPNITPVLKSLKGRAVIVEHQPQPVPEGVVLALIPGRAFDKLGNRLGRGGGTFDRLLADLECEKIGIAFDCQIVEAIPAEPHDIPMNAIITASKDYRISK